MTDTLQPGDRVRLALRNPRARLAQRTFTIIRLAAGLAWLRPPTGGSPLIVYQAVLRKTSPPDNEKKANL